jgi:hypothetical protein
MSCNGFICRLLLHHNKPVRTHDIRHNTLINASAACVWQHITEVDITAFPHPPYLTLLGIPKPLRAEILQDGVGGSRIAHFVGGKRFTQEITEWQPATRFGFTFRADPGFRVGHVLDLSDGVFRMASGAYTIIPQENGVTLVLESQYTLHGLVGFLLALPVRLVLNLFQAYLLAGIKANAEREYGAR